MDETTTREEADLGTYVRIGLTLPAIFSAVVEEEERDLVARILRDEVVDLGHVERIAPTQPDMKAVLDAAWSLPRQAREDLLSTLGRWHEDEQVGEREHREEAVPTT